MRLAVTGVRRNPIEALSPDIKSGNYLNNILAVAEAVKTGADDCLMLNPQGHITEASNSNVLFVIDGQLVTPSFESGILRGITKAAIAKMSSAHGFALHERVLTADDVSRSTECFVTSATREVMPVCGILLEKGKWLNLPEGGGKMTRQVAAAYKDYVQKYVSFHSELKLI
jgi:branched-chain amino acid aminotransferase